VLVGVVLAGLFGMMRGVQRMAVRDMGMVAGLFMIARLVVPGGFAVMFGGLFVMFGSLTVMLRSWMSHWGVASLGCEIKSNNIQESTSAI
jgi:hypothetical protein